MELKVMNLVELQRKLIAAGRTDCPSDRVPLAFEKRIMALLSSGPLVDQWAVWSRALWFAAAPCVAIMLISTWVFFKTTPEVPATDFAQQFNQTMLVAMDQDNEFFW